MRFRIYLPLALLVLASRVFATGGDVSGGGSLVYFPGRAPFLLDFLELEPDFRELNGFAPKKRSLTFPSNPHEVLYGLRTSPQELSPEAYQLLEERLSLWEKNSPKTVGEIRSALRQNYWRLSVFSLHPALKRAQEPALIAQKKGRLTIIGAVIQHHGVFINDWIWDQKLRGITSRAGFFAHEALRSAQLNGHLDISDLVLQKIVALLMLRNPCQVAELDHWHTNYSNTHTYQAQNLGERKNAPFYERFVLNHPGLSSRERDFAQRVLDNAQLTLQKN